MITFGLPDDPALLAAIGKVAIRHGQHDYVLRMTIKTLLDLTVRDALDATHRQGSGELRELIKRLVKQRLGEGEALVRLRAIMTRSARATQRRNELLHGLWASTLDGEHVIRHDDQTFQPIPTVIELEDLATKFEDVWKELNEARLDGFLKKALEAARARRPTPPEAQPARPPETLGASPQPRSLPPTSNLPR